MEDQLKEVRNKAKIEYIKGTKQKDICNLLDIPFNTLQSWIKRGGWKEEKKLKNSAQKKENSALKKIGAPIGNMNAKGNKGGSPAPGNKNAEKHGFFSKYLPQDTLDLINGIETMNPLDILWGNIQIQYAAIIRAQKIMYVEDQEDVTTTQIAKGYSDSGSSEKWEVQQAWDKHATFLNAQSRAMKTIEGMIKQYDGLCKSDLATEEQRLRIDKLKVEIDALKGEKKDTSLMDALIEGRKKYEEGN
ncbi:hypothetical protein GC105_10660 [Alkalibaculum sp. M08DMB]|uniref:Terminase ATPase subunit N-terminal domain-containing protein n=1 Tax=Alkalibaculum sporogenes TaxID=2655001 RepID=A0A6A7K9N7_9FIRM|nr:hypothetical protein [Alkalibaculum sporogenes]